MKTNGNKTSNVVVCVSGRETAGKHRMKVCNSKGHCAHRWDSEEIQLLTDMTSGISTSLLWNRWVRAGTQTGAHTQEP